MLLKIVSFNVNASRNNLKVKRYFIFLKTRNLTLFFYKKLIPITQMKSCGNVNWEAIYSKFRLIGPSVNRVSSLIGPNCEEQNPIKDNALC